MEENVYRAFNGDGIIDGKRGSQRAIRIDFHPVNMSVYDGRWSIPTTYEVKSRLTRCMANS